MIAQDIPVTSMISPGALEPWISPPLPGSPLKRHFYPPFLISTLKAKYQMERKTFSKDERISKDRDFERLRDEGIKVSKREYLIVAVSNDYGFTRLGIRVGKKRGNAPTRNRIKRLIREVFRQNKDAFPPSTDILIAVIKTPELLTYQEFERDILNLVGILREKL